MPKYITAAPIAAGQIVVAGTDCCCWAGTDCCCWDRLLLLGWDRLLLLLGWDRLVLLGQIGVAGTDCCWDSYSEFIPWCVSTKSIYMGGLWELERDRD